MCIHDNEDCLSYGLPRHYIAYHLRDKTINIDGKLDDEAWAEVPWTEDFVGGLIIVTATRFYVHSFGSTLPPEQ